MYVTLFYKNAWVRNVIRADQKITRDAIFKGSHTVFTAIVNLNNMKAVAVLLVCLIGE